jgi:hypothetical protein
METHLATDLSLLNERLDKLRKQIDVEDEKKLSEITQEFNKSGLSIKEFFAKKCRENLEKSSKNLYDLLYDSLFEKSNNFDGLFNILK